MIAGGPLHGVTCPICGERRLVNLAMTKNSICPECKKKHRNWRDYLNDY
jgi:RNA polymerase subunit RPABC4/transcription elongation factor Spt4